ncbi:MAG TPA: hypothetical protein VGS60_15765 [Actinomycetes bacterium]|nr:hypothetical protein [Actinomycetes bacterium]
MTSTTTRRPGSAGDSDRVPARWAVLAAALGLLLAAPVATWWLVGDLSTVPVSDGRDYAFQPWPIDPAVARAAGAGSLVVVAVAVVVLGWSTVRLDTRWCAVLVPLAAAGFIAGAGWRVMTAGVAGANIGAGFVVLLGGPLVLVLLVWALALAAYLLSHTNHAHTPPIDSDSK